MGRLDWGDDGPVRRRLTPAEQKRYVQKAGKCMACGLADITVLDVHHIKPFSKGGSNKPWNLSVLCPTCHRKAQNGHLNPSALAPKPERKAPRRRQPKALFDW